MLVPNHTPNHTITIDQLRILVDSLSEDQKTFLKEILFNYHPENLMDEAKIKNFYESVKARVDRIDGEKLKE